MQASWLQRAHTLQPSAGGHRGGVWQLGARLPLRVLCCQVVLLELSAARPERLQLSVSLRLQCAMAKFKAEQQAMSELAYPNPRARAAGTAQLGGCSEAGCQGLLGACSRGRNLKGQAALFAGSPPQRAEPLSLLFASCLRTCLLLQELGLGVGQLLMRLQARTGQRPQRGTAAPALLGRPGAWAGRPGTKHRHEL